MRAEETMTDWLQLIRSEYHEIPDLDLTKPEARRLWNLDALTCDELLDSLEAAQFLRRTRAGSYIKA